jgi:trehalose 6-phosphate synthase/phosphatase
MQSPSAPGTAHAQSIWAQTMDRLLIVAHRAPVTVSRMHGEVTVSPGGVGPTSALSGALSGYEHLWIGWPGACGDAWAGDRGRLEAECERQRISPIFLSPDEQRHHADGFCSGVLWPLLHYVVGQIPLEMKGFDHYEAVNRRFADTVQRHYRPGDLVWVHDYQLMLAPQMIRDRIPQARIGYFHHVPFPSPDVFCTLPFRDRLVRGLLGADVIGFHTPGYLRNFLACAARTTGIATTGTGISWQNRSVRAEFVPMGVDAAAHDRLARSPEVTSESTAQRGPGDIKILLGIDRLDYTKGIPRRLLAFERLLAERPELQHRVRLIQVAVPSRTTVDAYRSYRERVDGLIGRLQGALGTSNWAPIHYISRPLSPVELAALYRAADVMLVTPIRDGMNLVAKEFVACRADEDGVLVLSEFAGAAVELAEAVQVNPFDIAGQAAAYHRALIMPAAERQARMRALRRRVFGSDLRRWTSNFLILLRAGGSSSAEAPPGDSSSMGDALLRLRGAERLCLLLDYDGTLVPFAPTPELARPDVELLATLRALAARPRTDVHVVSGRTRTSLVDFLGELPIHLHAEHGLWCRPPGEAGHEVTCAEAAWKAPFLSVLREFADRTPGSLVEEKPAGLAWHYRMVDLELGRSRADDLHRRLVALLAGTPVEILLGHAVIELRVRQINKGLVVSALRDRRDDLLVAIGDDQTVEDMFRALPMRAISIRVGPGESRAGFRVADHRAVRTLLSSLLA